VSNYLHEKVTYVHWVTCLLCDLLKGEIQSFFPDYSQFPKQGLLLYFFFFAQKINDHKYEFLTGTDHAIPHLYDINTFQCYLSSNVPETSPNGAINQACELSIDQCHKLSYLCF